MNLLNPFTIRVVAYVEARAEIQFIRQTVFQLEQGVEPEIEFDGQDDTATHLLAYCNNKPVGTARIRYLNHHLAKIERVAVLSAYRGKGIGKEIMQAAIAFLNEQQVSEIKINAQIQAKAFYQKLGFEQQGSEFDEAGIPHIEMRVNIKALS